MNRLLKALLEMLLEAAFGKHKSHSTQSYTPKPSFDFSKLRCSCGCKDTEDILVDVGFQKILNTLLEEYGDRIIIDSGYRCETHNVKVGGAKQSKHTIYPVMAADLRIDGVPAKEVYKFLDSTFYLSGLGYYLNNKTGWEFIHIDSRKEHARWLRVDYKYMKITQDNLYKYGLL